jgi:hypothetical protein
VTNGSYGLATNFANSLGDVICHGEELISMIIEKQVIVAEMRPAHMPVKVLCLEVKGKDIRKQAVQRSAYVADGLGVDIRQRSA